MQTILAFLIALAPCSGAATLFSDEFIMHGILTRSRHVTAARQLQRGPPGGGPGGGGASSPGTATATTCSSVTTCAKDGSNNYISRTIEYSTTTGIFTGSLTTNTCPNHAGAWTYNGVLDTLVPSMTASCIKFTFPVTGYTGPVAAPLLNSVGFTITGGEMVYGPMDAGFTLGQITTNSCGSCPQGTDTLMCGSFVEAACGTSKLKGNTTSSMHMLMSDCGGHAGYHNHEKLSCEYSTTATGHSTLTAIMLDGRGLYGQYENTGTLPSLDACNGHTGPVPAITIGSDTYPAATNVYHYHITPTAPFTVGCFGPVASLAAANALYPSQCTPSGTTCNCAATATASCTCADASKWSGCTSIGYYSNYIINCPIYQHMGTSFQSQVDTTLSTCKPCAGNCGAASSTSGGTTTTGGTTTGTTTGTSSASSASSNLAIGLGVGLGVGIPVVLVVVYFFVFAGKGAASSGAAIASHSATNHVLRAPKSASV